MKQQACLIAAVGVSGLVCSQSQQKHCYVTQCYTLHYTHTSHIMVVSRRRYSATTWKLYRQITCGQHVQLRTKMKNNVLTWWCSFFTSRSISMRTTRVHRDNGTGRSSRQRYRMFIATTMRCRTRTVMATTWNSCNRTIVAGACRWQHDETVQVYVHSTTVSSSRSFVSMVNTRRCSNSRSTHQRSFMSVQWKRQSNAHVRWWGPAQSGYALARQGCSKKGCSRCGTTFLKEGRCKGKDWLVYLPVWGDVASPVVKPEVRQDAAIYGYGRTQKACNN